MKKIYLNWDDVQTQVQDIIRQMHLDGWTPDYVVGLTRGGLSPAVLISQYLDVPMQTLKVSLRDGTDSDCESNFWMAEDATMGKNILIVDDINDSGATINWIRQDWQNESKDPRWADIWGGNVRIAVLIDNQASGNEVEISYSALEINKMEDPCWIVFPWEDWWRPRS